jgi:hypothetical protein
VPRFPKNLKNQFSFFTFAYLTYLTAAGNVICVHSYVACWLGVFIGLLFVLVLCNYCGQNRVFGDANLFQYTYHITYSFLKMIYTGRNIVQ